MRLGANERCAHCGDRDRCWRPESAVAAKRCMPSILQCPATSAVIVVDHRMHMWMKQVGLALVAAGGTLVAVYATTAPQSAMATPPVSRLADLGPNKTVSRKPTAWRRDSGRPFRPARSASRFGTSRSRRRAGSRRTDTAPARCEVDGVIAPVDTAATARADQLPGRAAGGMESPRRAARRRRR